MPLHQIDLQLRVSDAVPEGAYSWTQCWYHVDGFIDPTSGPAYNAIVEFYNALLPVGCTRTAIRAIRLVPGPVDFGTFTVPYVGTRPVDSPLTLINTARLALLAGGRKVGYKRLRLPLQLSEMRGGLLTSSFTSMLTSHTSTLLAAGDVCNYRGEVVDAISVLPAVYPWQLRHGTKRRSRVVLA